MFQTAFNESLTKEELKGGQKKLDVAKPYGKLTGADFKKLRGTKKLKEKKTLDKEGNAFSGAVAKAKKDGIQPGEKIKVGGKTYPVKESMMEAPRSSPNVPSARPKPTPEEPSDSDIWQKSLDKDTDPSDFDAGHNPALKLDTEGVQKARAWIKKLEDMATFINGMDENSLNSQINALEMRNSIPFKGIVRRKEKQITDIAEKLRALAELFKTVVTGSQKKIHDATAR